MSKFLVLLKTARRKSDIESVLVESRNGPVAESPATGQAPNCCLASADS